VDLVHSRYFQTFCAKAREQPPLYPVYRTNNRDDKASYGIGICFLQLISPAHAREFSAELIFLSASLFPEAA